MTDKITPDRFRQLLYDTKSFDRLAFNAIFGKYSKNRQSTYTDGNPDLSYKVIFADSATLASGNDYEVWPLGSTNMGRPSSAEILDIVSSSTQDDSGGTGIDAVFVEGLDGDYLPQSELVFLDGTTTVNSVNSYIHVSEVNCLNITTSGTTNAGNITITNTTSGDSLGYVLAGDSISKQSQFLIPAGYNGIMLGGHFSTFRSSGSGERRATIQLEIVPMDGGAGDGILYNTLQFGSSSSGTDEIEFSLPLVVGEKVFLRPTASAEANNTQVTIQYALILVRDTIDIDSVF